MSRKARRRKKPSKPLPPWAKIAVKWAIYIFAGLISFCMSTLSASDSPALIMFPLALAIAVYEPEIPAAIAGAYCGLLLDMAADKLLGFTAFYLCIICGLISALFRQFLRKNIINYAIVSLIAGGMYLYIDWYFFYSIWQKEGYSRVLGSVILPSSLKTYLWGLVIFAVEYFIYMLLGRQRKLVIEEQSKLIDRL